MRLLKNNCDTLRWIALHYYNRGNTIIKVATKTVAVGFISIGLSNVGDINLIPTSFSILQPAVADVRAQQKRTYFRFAPKVSIYESSLFCFVFNKMMHLPIEVA